MKQRLVDHKRTGPSTTSEAKRTSSWGRESLASGVAIVGAALLLSLTPAIVVWFWSSCRYHDGSLSWIVSVLANRDWQQLRASMPQWDNSSALLLMGWVVAQALLYVFLPGPTGRGQQTPAGHVLTYHVNGWRVYVLSHVLFVAGSYLGLFPATIIYDHWGGLLLAANVFGFSLAAFAYVKACLAPTHPGDVKFTGNLVYDFFMGAEMNPRIGQLDFKLFFNGRPGICAWTLVDLSFAAAQYRATGHVTNSIALATLLHVYYVADFFWNEDWYLRTIDIAHDHFGFYLAWGDMVWLPWMYTLQTAYLAAHPVTLPWPVFAAVLALGTGGYMLFRSANAQKDEFRRSGGATPVWGKPAKYIETEYRTGDGKLHRTKLLTSGFWGLARHFNYVGDLMLSLAMCASCGFDGHVLPYFYIVYMAILLAHRTFRDGSRCRAKYGADWDAYCKVVPYRIIPHVF